MKKIVTVKEYAKVNPLVWKRLRDNSLFPIHIMGYMLFYKNT
jgi:hypothetical protein